MTVGTAIATAALRVTGDRIPSAFSSADQIAVELADLANDVARDIAESHQWNVLTKIATITGDGTQTAFDMPSDYDRMLIGGGVQNANSWLWDYRHVPSVEEWLHLTNRGFVGLRNAWIILGGQMQFNPAPSGTANFAYVSSMFARGEDGTLKREFTQDDDTFLLSESLLTLGMVWRYREQKGLEYAEDMAAYGISLSQQQVRDGGPSVIRRSSSVGRYANARTAWPWSLG